MNSLLTVLSPAIKQLKKLKMLFVSGNPFIVEGIRSVMELEDTCKIDTFLRYPRWVKEISVHIYVVTCAFTKLVLMFDFQVVILLVTDYFRK